jgi:ABC-2 type transport system ATP-binding protein
MPIITADNLVKEFRLPKRYGGPLGGLRTLFTPAYTVKRAVDGVSFTVDEGELVGYLGPNGAGKSTTIKMLTGILVPTSGMLEVAGLVPWERREENALRIGVVFGQRSQLWWDLPLIDSLRLVGKLYRVPAERYRRNLDRFTELLGLGAFLQTPVRQLSLGQRMRGDLAAAMLYEPPLLYLDEPTVGLDVLAKERMRSFIAEVNREHGTTIILTTHDLADVEKLCRRIIFIDQGKVLYDGPVQRLKEQFAPWRELVVQLVPDGGELPPDELFDLPGVEVARREGAKVWLRFDPKLIPAPRLIAEVTARCPVSDLAIVEPELEGVVRGIYAEREAALTP